MFVTGVAALFYASIGVQALVRPATLLAPFGIVARGADARNEVRAVYGGLTLAFAVLLVWSAWAGVPLVAWTIGVLTLGMAGGRIVSALIDRRLGVYPAVFLMLEAVIGVALMGF